MKKVTCLLALVSAIALGTLVFLNLPANLWADEPCIFFLETDGEMRIHGYDENGTPIQIFNSVDELVWEGIIGVEPEVLTGFAPGTYMLVGPADGRTFGAVAGADKPVGTGGGYVVAESEKFLGGTGGGRELKVLGGELKVLTVLWVPTKPGTPHVAYNGHPTTFKAIARGGTDTYTYEWDFNGDGVYDSGLLTTTDPYNLSAKYTYPDQTSDKLFIARIRVESGSDTVTGEYRVLIVADATIQVKVDVAIDDGLWKLYTLQARVGDQGYWTNANPDGYSASSSSSPTASAVHAFEINGHLETGNYDKDPYVETVSRGLKYMFTTLNTVSFPEHPADTNGNGYGIQVNSWRPIYELGQVMDAIAATGTPDVVATTGETGIIGRTYKDILTDMVDMYAWGQYDDPGVGGGWRYDWNTWPDNSAAQWGAIGMLAAEDIFGISIPQWVKDGNNAWLNYSYQSSTGRFGYTSSGAYNYDGWATTPSGLVQLAFDDKTTSDSRWIGAENYIAINWDSWRNSQFYYAYYAFAKAMRAAQQDADAEPEPVVNFSLTGLDWYGDPDRGLARRLVDTQQSDGGWPYSGWPYVGYALTDAWCVIILNRTFFEPSPVAVAKASPKEANPSDTITFDHSGSYHLNPEKTLVKFRWDYDDADGVDWSSPDFETTDINEKPTHIYGDIIGWGEMVEHKVTLQVEDGDGKTDEDNESVIIRISKVNHAPVADADPTESDPNYEVGKGGKVLLDASESYDPDSDEEPYPGCPPDSIVKYEWDLNSDDVYDVEGETYLFDTPDDWEIDSTHTVQLRVTDDGRWAGPDGGGSLSSETSATIYVVPNLPPDADAGEYQTVEQATAAGTTVTLDGSGSTDDGQLQPLTYTWTEGATTLGTGVTLDYTFQLGIHEVTLTVYDGQFSDSDTVVIEVQDTTPPILSVPTSITLWPPNHKYQTIKISDCVASAEDICDVDIGVDDIVITSVSSDEPEDAKGNGDGNTKNDIVIVDSQTVQLRAERQGDGNGRVYTINYQVTDTSGNTATGACKISVPHDQDGEPAVDDGPGAGYTVYP